MKTFQDFSPYNSLYW